MEFFIEDDVFRRYEIITFDSSLNTKYYKDPILKGYYGHKKNTIIGSRLSLIFSAENFMESFKFYYF